MTAKARGILFSAPMVRALLETPPRKSQTRRLVKGARGSFWDHAGYFVRMVAGRLRWFWRLDGEPAPYGPSPRCPYGQVGDLLYVRETWWQNESIPGIEGVAYRADGEMPAHMAGTPWRSPIHMPRRFARIWLEIIEVRCQRLQEISEEDAKAEGMEFHDGDGVGHSGWRHSRDHGFVYGSAISAFAAAWEAIHGPGSWERDKGKWVWALTFNPAPAPVQSDTPDNEETP